MKKYILPAIIVIFVSLLFMTTSCNNLVCIKCYKIADSTDTQEMCTGDQNKRNDFTVEHTQNNYNCAEEIK